MSYSASLQTPSITVPVKFTDPLGNKSTIKVAFKRFNSVNESLKIRRKLAELLITSARLNISAPKPLVENDPRYDELDDDTLNWIANYKIPTEEDKEEAEKKIASFLENYILWYEDVSLTNNETGKVAEFKSTKIEKTESIDSFWEKEGFKSLTELISFVYLQTFWVHAIAEAYSAILLNQSVQDDARRKN